MFYISFKRHEGLRRMGGEVLCTFVKFRYISEFTVYGKQVSKLAPLVAEGVRLNAEDSSPEQERVKIREENI